jgi:transmembrane 9 superfamily protein 2/4
MVNKLTSTKTLLPIDSYPLPFCAPVYGLQIDKQNWGQMLAGDRIESSPYRLFMKTEMFCEQLCIANQGRREQRGAARNKVAKTIQADYHNNWIVDNLNAASRTEDDTTITTKYWQGFPVGYVDETTKKAYIYNHVNIEIMYHPVETETDKHRVVRFTVEPFSIKHDFQPNEEDSETIVAKILNPIASCDLSQSRMHTDWDMVTAPGREPQEASGIVLFTYDVIWTENKELHWASRWDVYLSMDDAVQLRENWAVLMEYLVLAFALSGVIVAILICNLRRYNRLATDEEETEGDLQSRWQSLHADVFRPPSFSPMLLSVCCGTGIQLLCATLLTIFAGATGFASPARRGYFLMYGLFCCAVMGIVAGFTMARMYKTLGGERWQRATFFVAFGFYGICFATFIVMNVNAFFFGSTMVIPLVIIIPIGLVWFGISTPLVFLGAYIGYQRVPIDFPVETSKNPRPIPDQPRWTNIPFTMAAACVPFVLCPTELNYIFDSLWKGYYYELRFLLSVFLILFIVTAENTIILTYCQLCYEDYRWWWRSFLNAGSTAIYVFLYSCYYFAWHLEASYYLGTCIFYFGYMALICAGLFIILGSIGVLTSLWFNKRIYASLIKTGIVVMDPLDF